MQKNLHILADPPPLRRVFLRRDAFARTDRCRRFSRTRRDVLGDKYNKIHKKNLPHVVILTFGASFVKLLFSAFDNDYDDRRDSRRRTDA